MLTAHVVAIFTRLLTASFALISLKLTYEVLSPEDFSLLNYLLFIIAVSIALSSPINRIFWAENSYDKFIDSIYCVSAITVIVSAILIIIYGMINDTHWHAIASIWFLSCLYSVYKIVDSGSYDSGIFRVHGTGVRHISIFVGMVIPACSIIRPSSFGGLHFNILFDTSETPDILNGKFAVFRKKYVVDHNARFFL